MQLASLLKSKPLQNYWHIFNSKARHEEGKLALVRRLLIIVLFGFFVVARFAAGGLKWLHLLLL